MSGAPTSRRAPPRRRLTQPRRARPAARDRGSGKTPKPAPSTGTATIRSAVARPERRVVRAGAGGRAASGGTARSVDRDGPHRAMVWRACCPSRAVFPHRSRELGACRASQCRWRVVKPRVSDPPRPASHRRRRARIDDVAAATAAQQAARPGHHGKRRTRRETVYRCFDGAGLPWLAPVGRLDKASEGLLLFCNDPMGRAHRRSRSRTGQDVSRAGRSCAR